MHAGGANDDFFFLDNFCSDLIANECKFNIYLKIKIIIVDDYKNK